MFSIEPKTFWCPSCNWKTSGVPSTQDDKIRICFKCKTVLNPKENIKMITCNECGETKLVKDK
jgi:transcription elongation factor Elf1